MTTKTALRYLVIRIGVLVLSLSSMFAIWYFNNDPHRHCVGECHRHTDTGLGLFVGFFMVIVCWLAILFLEGIIYFIKGKNNLGWIALTIILILGIFVLAVI